ncbi:MAG: acyl carrier protein [Planctomycetaceae bacterium]
MIEALRECFSVALGKPKEQIPDGLIYRQFPEWDSVAHLALVNEIEARFEIMLETEDIIAMNSFQKALELVQTYSRKQSDCV